MEQPKSEHRKMLERIPAETWDADAIQGALISHVFRSQQLGLQAPAWDGHTLWASTLMAAVPDMLDEIDRLRERVRSLEITSL